MIRLTDEEIPYEVGNDNIAYHSAYLSGAKAQLKKAHDKIEAMVADGYYLDDILKALLKETK